MACPSRTGKRRRWDGEFRRFTARLYQGTGTRMRLGGLSPHPRNPCTGDGRAARDEIISMSLPVRRDSSISRSRLLAWKTLIEMAYADELVLGILCKYTSEPTARGMLQRAKDEIGLGGEHIPFSRFSGLRRALNVGIEVFFDARDREIASEELRALEEERDVPTSVLLPISDEHETRRARMRLREMSLESGAPTPAAMVAAYHLTEFVFQIWKKLDACQLRISIEPGPPLVARLTAVDAQTGDEPLERVIVLQAAEDATAS
jgi:hypothetical protein